MSFVKALFLYVAGAVASIAEGGTMHHPRLIALLVFISAAACGGTVQFAGAQPFTIAGAATPPPPPSSRARLSNNKIEFDEKIQFEANSEVIKDASSPLLHDIAQVIHGNPQVTKVSIEGHASSDGDPKQNKKLSDDRAKAVMTYLIQKEHVDPSKLTAKGWGSEKPIAPNTTEDGREKNRRVEFLVVGQK
jgi:outer membrane protein OmpA-like peptidoglycan-associated protein